MPGREEQDRLSYMQGDSSGSTLAGERNTSSKVHLRRKMEGFSS